TIADMRGWTRFNAFQLEYSLLQRTPERDLMPMAAGMDLAVTAWAALAGGALTGKYLKGNAEDQRLKDDSKRLNERSRRITEEVVAVAGEIGCSPAQVALNWVRQKPQVVIPVIGARKLSQIEDSLGCLEHPLDEEQIARLDEVSAIEMGFPHDFLDSDSVRFVTYGGTYHQIENHRS
ncbi:MAG: aldo/keto reductase, partial [Bacteroidota bacterium]